MYRLTDPISKDAKIPFCETNYNPFMCVCVCVREREREREREMQAEIEIERKSKTERRRERERDRMTQATVRGTQTRVCV